MACRAIPTPHFSERRDLDNDAQPRFDGKLFRPREQCPGVKTCDLMGFLRLQGNLIFVPRFPLQNIEKLATLPER